MRRKPKFSVIERSPYVLMYDWLTACRLNLLGISRLSFLGGGKTLTSAPVSMRKRMPVVLSVMKRDEFVVKIQGSPSPLASGWSVSLIGLSVGVGGRE